MPDVKKVKMTVTFRVEGDEVVENVLTYENTNMKTVVLVEQALMGAFGQILEGQK